MSPRPAGPADIYASPGARLDAVLADVARRLGPDRFYMYRLDSDHTDWRHPNYEPEVQSRRSALLDEARRLLESAGTAPDGDADAMMARANRCLALVRDLSAPSAVVVTVSAGDRMLVYWDWQYAYTLDVSKRTSAELGYDTDVALHDLVAPDNALDAYGAGVLELASRFALRPA